MGPVATQLCRRKPLDSIVADAEGTTHDGPRLERTMVSGG